VDTGAEVTREALRAVARGTQTSTGAPASTNTMTSVKRPDFHRGRGDSFSLGDPYYGDDPAPDGYAAPEYWYYCPSYGDYYPDVESCPDPWVPEPAS